MDRWVGKVALVTGAANGIGNAVARRFLQNGLKVVACDKNDRKLKAFAADANNNNSGPGEIFPYHCDVRDETQMLAMFKFIKETFGLMHVCVNSAGLGYDAPLISGSTQEWREMIDVNVIGLCIGCRESVKLMRESGVDDGHVFNINSTSGHRIVDIPFYAATKFAVTALCEGLRRELFAAKSHIRCTSMSPGDTRTEFLPRMNKAKEGEGYEAYDTWKCLQAEDVAEAVLYALQAPPHVNVNQIILRNVEQEK